MLPFKGLFLYTITFCHVPIVNRPTRISNKRLSSSLRYSLGIHMTLTANSFHQLNTRASYVVPLSKYTSLFSTNTFENLNGTYSSRVDRVTTTIKHAFQSTQTTQHWHWPCIRQAFQRQETSSHIWNRLKAMYYVWIHNLRSFSWISLCRLAHLQSRMVSCNRLHTNSSLCQWDKVPAGEARPFLVIVPHDNAMMPSNSA